MLIARIGRFFATVARHAVPIGGIFGSNWHPATAIGVYWLESVLLVLATTTLCALMQRRASPAALEAARHDGDVEGIRVFEAERVEAKAAGIDPLGVLAFHGVSLFVFAGFLGGVLLIIIGNGHVTRPFEWSELRDGATAMMVVVAAGLLFDLWGFHHFTVAAVRARVDACMSRWALLWLLGFFGTLLMMFTGRAMIFFSVFSVLKVTFESWARLARLFGWRSLKDRAASATP